MKSDQEQLDYPLAEVAEKCERLISEGATVWQKFSCAGCGARQTMEEPNVLYTNGRCEECGAVSDLVEQGCNFVVMMQM